jgi:hypothetical protein
MRRKQDPVQLSILLQPETVSTKVTPQRIVRAPLSTKAIFQRKIQYDHLCLPKLLPNEKYERLYLTKLSLNE